jgi:transcriptional regulator with XRE-family HTH domain
MKPTQERLARNLRERRKAIANRLKDVRVAQGLSQALVAEALGYSCQADIAKIEKGGKRGGRMLDIVELENFAELYHRPLDYFATRSTQIKADQNRYGYHYDFALRENEFDRRLAEAKERRNRARLLKLEAKRRNKERASSTPV